MKIKISDNLNFRIFHCFPILVAKSQSLIKAIESKLPGKSDLSRKKNIKLWSICTSHKYTNLRENINKAEIGLTCRRSLVPPILIAAIARVDSSDKLSTKMRAGIIGFISLMQQNPKLLVPGKTHWTVVIGLTYKKYIDTSFLKLPDLKIYVSKHLFRWVPVQPNSLSLAHSQELRKTFTKYDVYILIPNLIKIIFPRLFKKLNVPVLHSTPGSSLVRLKEDNTRIIEGLNLGAFKSFVIHNAIFAHGNHIFDNRTLYFTDSTRTSLPNRPGGGAQSASRVHAKIEIFPFTTIGNLDEAILLGGTNNLMHFVLEELQRLQHFDSYVNPNLPLLVNGEVNHNILDLLHSVTKREILFCSSFEGIKVQKLHFICYVNPLARAMNGDAKSANLLFANTKTNLRAYFEQKLGMPDYSSQKRIFFVRSKDLFRKMKNQSELAKILTKELHFDIVNPEDVGFRDLRYLLSKTEILVGQYGAALANAIFLNPSASILQIKGPKDIQCMEYSSLFRHLGIREQVFNQNEGRLTSRTRIPGDFEVDIFRVVESIRKLLG